MDCKEILNKIANEYYRILGKNLIGIYVHGSIAFGCFNPNKSDIDFIVVVNNLPTMEEKEALIQTLLYLYEDAPTKGYEMSVVLYRFCKEFVYPTPFELHYSIAHLQRCRDNLREYCISMNGTDKDLAAHFTVIKKVGYTIWGKENLSKEFRPLLSKALNNYKSEIEEIFDRKLSIEFCKYMIEKIY